MDKIINLLGKYIGPNSTPLQIFIISCLVIFSAVYKYFIKPTYIEIKRCSTVIDTQTKSIQSIGTVLERMETNLNLMKKCHDEDNKISDLKITEAQNDINEIKSILSQFQGALMYNARLFNKELE